MTTLNHWILLPRQKNVKMELLKPKKHNVNHTFSKLTGTSDPGPQSESIYKVDHCGLTKFFKLIGDGKSILMQVIDSLQTVLLQ